MKGSEEGQAPERGRFSRPLGWQAQRRRLTHRHPFSPGTAEASHQQPQMLPGNRDRSPKGFQTEPSPEETPETDPPIPPRGPHTRSSPMSRYPESEPAGPPPPPPPTPPPEESMAAKTCPARGRSPPSSSVPAGALAAPSRAPEEHRDQGRGSTAAGPRPSGCIRALSRPAPQLLSPKTNSGGREPAPSAQRPQRPAGDLAAGTRWRCARCCARPPGRGRRSGPMPTCSSLRRREHSDASFTQAFPRQCTVSTGSVPGTDHAPGKGDR